MVALANGVSVGCCGVAYGVAESWSDRGDNHAEISAILFAMLWAAA